MSHKGVRTVPQLFLTYLKLGQMQESVRLRLKGTLSIMLNVVLQFSFGLGCLLLKNLHCLKRKLVLMYKKGIVISVVS